MDAFHTVEKPDQELQKVSNGENSLSLLGYRLRINLSTASPIPNRYLTGWGPKDGYDDAFPISLHLIVFLLTFNIWFLIVEGSLLDSTVSWLRIKLNQPKQIFFSAQYRKKN